MSSYISLKLVIIYNVKSKIASMTVNVDAVVICFNSAYHP